MEISPHASIQPSADVVLRLVEGEENHANIINLPAENITSTDNLNCGETPNEEGLDGESKGGQDPEPWDVQTKVIHEAEPKVLIRLGDHGEVVDHEADQVSLHQICNVVELFWLTAMRLSSENVQATSVVLVLLLLG